MIEVCKTKGKNNQKKWEFQVCVKANSLGPLV